MNHKNGGQRQRLSKRVVILGWLSIIGWSCLIAALVLFHYARPEIDYGILRYFGESIRTSWLVDLKLWYEMLLMLCCVVSLLSLYVNRTRVKHRPHRTRYNLILLFLIAVAMLIASQ